MIYADGGENMKLIRRQVNLMKCLNENPKASIRELGEILNVSVQTIKSDLQNMKAFLQDYGIAVELLSGGQLRLQGGENITCMLKASSMMMEFSLEKQVMLFVLLNEDFVVLQEVADALFVSKSLVEKVMPILMKKYPEELQSVRHYGIRNVATQLEKRSRFAELMDSYVQGIDFSAELQQFHVNHFPLQQYIEAKEIERGVAAVDYLQKIHDFSFTDEAVCQFFLQVIYMQSCYRRWKRVPVGSVFSDMVSGMPEDKAYVDAAAMVCRILQLENVDEKAYMKYLFMILRKQQMSDHTRFVDAMQELVNDIFKKIFERLSIDFHTDESLLKGLSVHLYTTIMRRSQPKTFSLDYSWDDIRHQYPMGFEMATIAAEVLQERFSYAVSNDEMTYLMLHFQAGIERLKNGEKKIRVLVVCHYGLAAASLIATRLEHIFRAVEVTDTISMQHFLQLTEIHADLVVSTERIVKQTIPVIYVTPLLEQNELQPLRRFIELHCINNLLVLAVRKAILLDMEEAASRDVVIQRAVQELEQEGLVSDRYQQSVIERENISATDVDVLAIPHGNPDFVKETRLVIVRVKKPVHWSVSDVRYVFLFAVSKEEFTNNFALFSTFYKKLVRSNLRKEIQKMDWLSSGEFRDSLAHLLSL